MSAPESSISQILDRDVIFVSNVLANGGAARVLTLLAASFSARGHRVAMLCFNSHPSEYSLAKDVSKVYGPSSGSGLAKIKRVLWIRRIVRANPGAVIVSFEYFVNMQTILACLGLRNRVIISERNDPARVGNSFRNRYLRAFLYRLADLLVCQTDDAAAFFSNRIEKCVILNPIKPDLPAPAAIGGRRRSVVTFGRLEKQKNLPMLIEAFSAFHQSHPDYTLEIYGDGAEERAVRALIESLGLADVASVHRGRSDIHEVVRECAMFVMSSDYEGLSNSMVEAMAIGLPSICTDCPCGGARMVIDDGQNGLLVPVGDAAALTKAMASISDNHSLAEKLSANGSHIRDRLAIDLIADEWWRACFAVRGA